MSEIKSNKSEGFVLGKFDGRMKDYCDYDIKID